MEPLCIYRDNEIIHEPTPISKEVENPYDSARYGIYGHKMIYEGYRIEVSYPFSGDAILFNVRPNSFTIGGAYAELRVNELNNTLSLVFEVWDQNAEQFTHNKVLLNTKYYIIYPSTQRYLILTPKLDSKLN